MPPWVRSMDDVLIHIGYHKTGTTWLQNELFVPWNDVFEPLSQNDTKQSTLARHFYNDENGQLLSPFDLNEKKIREELTKILELPNRNFTGKIPVMSRERLSGHPSSGGFDAKVIAERIKNIFPNAKMFIVIREQREALLSNYFQYLHEGGIFNIKNFLTTKYDGFRPYFSLNYLKYDHLVGSYIKLFGKENVLVLPYELFRSNPGEFFQYLGQFVGRKIVVDQANVKKVINKRRFLYAKYRFRLLNYFTVSNSYNNYSALSNDFTRPTFESFLVALGHFLPDSLDRELKQRLRKRIRRIVKDYYVKSNLRLQKMIGYDLSAYGYFPLETAAAGNF